MILGVNGRCFEQIVCTICLGRLPARLETAVTAQIRMFGLVGALTAARAERCRHLTRYTPISHPRSLSLDVSRALASAT